MLDRTTSRHFGEYGHAQPVERRGHLQVFHLWRSLCHDDKLPSADALMNDARWAFTNHAIVIAIDSEFGGQVVMIGKALPMPVPSLPVAVSDIPGRTLVSRVTDHVLEPIANRAPVGFEAEFFDERGVEILYRAIVLPCASDGLHVDSVVGIITFCEADAVRRSGHAATDELAEAPLPPEAGGKTATQDPVPGNPPIGFTKSQIRRIIMSYKEKLAECMTIDGALAVALVDVASGMALATEQSSAKGPNLEVAAAGNTNVLRAKYETMKNLGIKEGIEDILITLESQIHMIRPATSESGKGLFIYLALDKTKANLAMARHKLRIIEKGLEI